MELALADLQPSLACPEQPTRAQERTQSGRFGIPQVHAPPLSDTRPPTPSPPQDLHSQRDPPKKPSLLKLRDGQGAAFAPVDRSRCHVQADAAMSRRIRPYSPSSRTWLCSSRRSGNGPSWPWPSAVRPRKMTRTCAPTTQRPSRVIWLRSIPSRPISTHLDPLRRPSSLLKTAASRVVSRDRLARRQVPHGAAPTLVLLARVAQVRQPGNS
ncbi:MAG: hypothetical protein ACI9K5_000997 [Gammaproteobacteria bacterium]|jgi:hypothetical protein